MIRVWMDIDGVLNLLGTPPAGVGLDVGPVVRLDTGIPWEEHELRTGHGGPSRREAQRRIVERTRHYPIRLDHNNDQRLSDLESRSVRIEWVTTWNDLAQTVFVPHVGHGHEWPVVTVGQIPLAGKYPSVVPQLEAADEAGDKVLWIDDDPGRPMGTGTKIRTDPVAKPLMDRDQFVLLRPRQNRGLADVWNDVLATLERWGA